MGVCRDDRGLLCHFSRREELLRERDNCRYSKLYIGYSTGDLGLTNCGETGVISCIPTTVFFFPQQLAIEFCRTLVVSNFTKVFHTERI